MIPLPSKLHNLQSLPDVLDSVTHDQRIDWLQSLKRTDLSHLWHLCEHTSVTAGHFCDAQGVIVRHHGKNSLPLFTSFEKRIAITDGQMHGYNHNQGIPAWFGGPGHFVVREDGNEVLFDYTVAPLRCPDSFPRFKSNDVGTAKLVFGGMIDRVRRVSAHCTIGKAFRNGRDEKTWFALIKQA